MEVLNTKYGEILDPERQFEWNYGDVLMEVFSGTENPRIRWHRQDCPSPLDQFVNEVDLIFQTATLGIGAILKLIPTALEILESIADSDDPEFIEAATKDYDQIIRQIISVAKDAQFQGVNLLQSAEHVFTMPYFQADIAWFGRFHSLACMGLSLQGNYDTGENGKKILVGLLLTTQNDQGVWWMGALSPMLTNGGKNKALMQTVQEDRIHWQAIAHCLLDYQSQFQLFIDSVETAIAEVVLP